MAKYRKKPVVIEASQWLKHDDHAQVRPFVDTRNQTLEGVHFAMQFCEHCEKPKGEHGWMNTLEGGHIVCPGDWIIRGIAGEYYPCKDSIFRAAYEPITEEDDDAK